MPEVGRLTAVIEGDSRSFESAVERAGGLFDGLRNKFGAGLAFGAGFAAAEAGIHGLAGAFDAAIGGSVKFNAQMEQAGIALETMLGSAQRAGTFIQQLQTFAEKTPFQFAGLEKASIQLLAVGVNSEKVIPLLRTIGTTVSAFGGSQQTIDRVTLAITQMIAKGKVSGEEVRQLAEANIPVWPMLAQAIGKTTAETMKLSEQGKISAEVFLQAMTQWSSTRFGDMLERQSRTAQGALSNLKDILQRLGGEAFSPLFNLLRDLALNLADFLGTQRAERWALTIKAAVQGATDAFRGLLQMLQPVGQFLGGMMDRVADLFGIPLPAARKSGEDAGKATADGFTNAVQQADPAGEALKDIERQIAAAKIPLGNLKIAADDIRSAYAGVIDPLKEQAAALEKQADFAGQLRNLQLENEASTLREQQARERILDSAKDTITASGRFIRSGKKPEETARELRLLDIESEQRKNKAKADWDELQRQISLAPIQQQIKDLEAAEKAALKPIEDQLKATERHVALLELAKGSWDAIKKAAEDAAAANKTSGGAPGAGLTEATRDQYWKDPKVLPPIDWLAKGKEIAGKVWDGFVTWFNENKGPMLAWAGGVATTMWEGFSGWITAQGTRLKDTVTATFSPDGIKAWESWRDGFLGNIDQKVKELQPGIRAMSYTIAKGLIDNAPAIARGFLYVLTEAAKLTLKATDWLNQLGFAIGEGIGIAIGQWLREHWADVIKFALLPMPGLPFAGPQIPALPSFTPLPAPASPGAATSPINVQVNGVTVQQGMSDAEFDAASKKLGADVLGQILAAQQAAA